MAAKTLSILTPLFLLLISNSTSDPSDESCLSSLYSSLTDPSHSLRNWTKPNFKNPCNGFTSFITGATCNNNRIYKLSLPSLSLSGTISPLLTNCTNLQTLDLSSNSLYGEIPNLSSLINLAVLNLSRNQLSGQIPLQLASCVYLNIIDLHDNMLSGSIPDNLGMLVRLSVFDVSNNDLSGRIPMSLANRSGGAGVRFNASSFIGNEGLFGYPLGMGRGKGLSVLAIVGIGLGSGLLSLVISFSVVCVWLRVSERREMGNGGGGGGGEGDGKVNHHHMPEY